MIGTLRRWVLRVCVGLIVAVCGHIALFSVAPVPLTPLMLLRLTDGHGLTKDWVPIEQMSPHLARSVIAAEDNRFCAHNGVDWSAVGDVVSEYREDGRLRGASTVSMQTVKNLYLWPGRSVIRKGIEVGLVHALEAAWSKERIMEVYLNIAELGPGVYGVQAAAQHHFDRDAADLTAAQAAALVSILPAPLHRDPTAQSATMGRRVGRIRRSIRNLGPLLECVPEADPAGPWTPKVRPSATSPSPAPDTVDATPKQDSTVPSSEPGPDAPTPSAFPTHSLAEQKQKRRKKKRRKKRK